MGFSGGYKQFPQKTQDWFFENSGIPKAKTRQILKPDGLNELVVLKSTGFGTFTVENRI